MKLTLTEVMRKYSVPAEIMETNYYLYVVTEHGSNQRFNVDMMEFIDTNVQQSLIDYFTEAYISEYGKYAEEDFVIDYLILLDDHMEEKQYILTNCDIDFFHPMGDEDIDNLMQMSAYKYAIPVNQN